MTDRPSIAEVIRVNIFLADYALADQSGKVNVLGAHWLLTGLGAQGATPQQALVVLFEVPASHTGEQFALSMTLSNGAGQPVQVAGPTGEQQPLRAQQLVQAQRPQIPGVALPSNLPGQGSVVMALLAGLPLAPGQLYTWRVEVDGNTHPQWEASFYVVGPPPPPVFGGPAGPADIPNLPRP